MDKPKPTVFCTFYDAPQHHFLDHPESPQRLHLLQNWRDNPPYPEITWLESTPAAESDILLVHAKSMLEELHASCLMGAHEFETAPSYVTPSSYQDALMAVGSTLNVSRCIVSEGHARGFAIVRPPGHHAESSRSMGFCLLNNIAIAAADAVASGVGKVAIIDIDAHHGNGTEEIFWETPEVGYLSIHEDNLYPGTGYFEEEPHAPGRVVNIPLPPFTNTIGIIQVFKEIVIPWIQQFQPQMLFVSAGFDAHFSDPLTTLTLDTQGIYRIAQILVDLADTFCQGRILFVLEGGYDSLALKENIQASLAALSGNASFPSRYGLSPGGCSEVNRLIEKLRKIHQIKEN